MSNFGFAARILSRSPGSTLAIAGILALGIGASTVIFSAFDALLLRPLPVRRPEQLVRMVQRFPKRSVTEDSFPYDYYQALHDRSTTLENVFAETPDNYRFAMTDPEPAEQIAVRAVTPGYFDALGITALHGRVLIADDEKESLGDPPAVLSYRFWQRRFHGDSRVMGRTITLHGVKFVIVGVLPRGFNGLSADTAPDVRVPNRAYPLLTGYPGINRTIELFGRLRTGFTRAQAEAECQAIFQSVVVPEYAEDLKELPQNGFGDLIAAGMNLDSLERGESILRNRYASALTLWMAFMGVLQLIVCTNVAGLLLARAAVRSQEIAVRLAVGARRSHLIRQVLAEATLLGSLGAAVGLWIAFLATPLVARALPPIRDVGTTLFPVSIDVRVDYRVFLFSLALSAVTVLLFSVAPVMAASRVSLESTLRGARSTGNWRKRRALITVQVALCTFLLVGAGLFVRTFLHLRSIHPGFDQEHVATFTADIGLARKDTSFLRLLTERVQQIPGVASAAISSVGVMREHGVGKTVAPAGQPTTPADYLDTNLNDVSAGYFETMGIRLLAGRSLEESDAREGSASFPIKVVVNQAFVKRFFPGVDPIGKRFGAGEEKVVGADYEIVGVVSDAKYRSLREPIKPIYYDLGSKYFRFVLNVRTQVRPESIFLPVQKAFASLDPSLAFLETHTLAEEVDQSSAGERLTAALASIFGGMAALLAGLGIYGLLAYVVARRQREIGIRMALGARPVDVMRMIVRQTLTMVGAGIAGGLAASLAAAPFVGSLLYGVAPFDAESFLAAATVVALVAGAATVIPAARAGRVEPSIALRAEN